MANVVEIKNLTKHFKSDFMVRTIKALTDVSFNIGESAAFGLIGHNGAGKTTLIKILTGLITASNGEATIFGKPVTDPSVRNDIGFLPERPYFYEYLTAREALNFYGKLAGMDTKLVKKRSEELLEFIGIQYAADRPMKSYSKGMLQRLGMVQAMLHDPKLVILDEPMSGLDPIGRGQIKDVIRLLRDQGKTIMFSTHILTDVEELCDNIALISGGHLKYTGSVEEITSKGSQGTEFKLANISADDLDWIKSLGKVTELGDSVMLMVENLDEPAQLMNDFNDKGIKTLHMMPKRKSLEEVVLDEFKSDMR